MSTLLRDIGTFDWCRATHGRLSASERRRYVAAVLLETARSTARLLLYRAGLGGGGPDPSRFAPPDTTLTRRVLEACGELDPMLVQHSYRSYLFARALGERDQLRCDQEALFAAVMLHDYAFPAPDTRDDRCFTLRGAEAAAELLSEASISPALLREVLDAITLHLNPWVTREQGVIPHLLHAGVLVDTVGVRAWELDRRGVQEVVERHPRHHWVTRGEPGLHAHARRIPASRANQLFRCGFGAALRLGPWRAHEARALRLEARQVGALPAHTSVEHGEGKGFS